MEGLGSPVALLERCPLLQDQATCPIQPQRLQWTVDDGLGRTVGYKVGACGKCMQEEGIRADPDLTGPKSISLPFPKLAVAVLLVERKQGNDSISNKVEIGFLPLNILSK